MKGQRRIRIVVLYIIIFVLLAGMAVFAHFRLNSLSASMESMQQNTNEYILSHQAVESMREASDYLTDAAREYVISGEVSHLEDYLEEVQVTKRREAAVEVLQEFSEDSESSRELSAAVENSNALAEVEMYAMRLEAEACGMSEDELNSYFAGTELSAEDAALSAEEKQARAISIMFDDHYNEIKGNIIAESLNSLDTLIEDVRGRQEEEYRHVSGMMRETQALFYLTTGLVILALALSTIFVVVPMRKAVNTIRQNKKLPETGAAEYAVLANAYNSMLELTQEHQEALSFEATHDELTGLYNRKAFEQARGEHAGEQTALLIVDVDRFKTINDTYGHEKGDEILQTVASALMESFRLEDYVCRIGGDEFAVIMRHMEPRLADVVRMKIETVREKLAARQSVPVTLSIGVAFSEGADADTLFKRADMALYKTKEKGRDGYAFYEEEAEAAETEERG